jgi:molybdopterin converting factor small subunit
VRCERELKVSVRLYGVFKSAAGSALVQLDIMSPEPTVRSVIAELVSRQHYGNLEQLVFDGEGRDPRPNALIMVSGREIGALAGLETKLNEGDELSLLPIAHGG